MIIRATACWPRCLMPEDPHPPVSVFPLRERTLVAPSGLDRLAGRRVDVDVSQLTNCLNTVMRVMRPTRAISSVG
jgi:hypothetical protein